MARFIGTELSARLGLPWESVDFTPLQNREKEYHFSRDDLLVAASPVYAGRLPNKILPDFSACLFGADTPAVPVCVFGNRSVDEALREWLLLLKKNGFVPLGAGAFACRHAFTDKIGTGRPDAEDFADMRDFTARISRKLMSPQPEPLPFDCSEIGPYYVPRKPDGEPAKFLKAKPKTDWQKCNRCGRCAAACPMGSIDSETLEPTGLCIKCQACVRGCPDGAKYFDDPDFLAHVAMLEQNFTRRAQNQLLV